MVCSFGSGQMTTLLDGRSNSQVMTDDIGRWKLAAQYIQRELKDADEVNLLDEEDMHVFGLRPMMDPLILVCCNSCKKPVKVSQYATHAELCKSLSSLVDGTTETNVVERKKKPPKKEKKKIQISISTQVASVATPERSAHANTAASNSHMDVQTVKKTSFPKQVKGREFPNGSQARSVKNVDSVNSREIPRKLDDHHSQTKGVLSVPAPLATKIYYSQRNQRLRSVISHMYHKSSSTEHDHGLDNMQVSDTFHHYETNDQQYAYTDLINEESSEAITEEFRTTVPSSFSDQFHVNNGLDTQNVSVSNLASNILPNPYPFDRN